MEPAASTNVAKVIILTDEIRDKLKYYVPEFGQYTIIGSTQLLQKALDNQERGFIKIKNHAKVHNGYLNYDHKDRDL